MRQGLSASLLALVVTLGTVAGAQLGRDSIAEIRPLFFSDLPDPPAVIDDAAPMQFGTPNAPQEISWGYPYASARPVCWGCPEKPETYPVAYDDPADAPIPTSGHAVARRVADIVAPGQPLSPAVQRYMAYPITSEESRHLAQKSRQPADHDGQREQTIGM